MQTIPGSGSTLGKALVEGGVDRIVFTGSAEVGQKIMELASHKFIPLTLELSGKDRMMIRADTDLNRTVSGLFGIFCKCRADVRWSPPYYCTSVNL